jgi:hypothetical protein
MLYSSKANSANHFSYMVSEPTTTNVHFSSPTNSMAATPPTGNPPPAVNQSLVENHTLATNPPTLPALVTFNHFNPLKLTSGNYNHWIPQIVPHLKGGNLFGYVDGTHCSPPPTLVTTTDGIVSVSPNPEFLHWQMQDQLILGVINSSLSENMLSHVT